MEKKQLLNSKGEPVTKEMIEEEFKDAVQKGIIDKIPVEIKLKEDEKSTSEKKTNQVEEESSES